MFENINWMVSNIFAASNDDFVIRENESPEDIETSSGVAATDENTRTCALCVALNNTVFRNDNKPEYYHPHCKCKITRNGKKLFILRLHPEQAGYSRTAFYGKNSSERKTGASGRIL